MRNVIEEYRKRGMKKVVEKEIEFYMVRKKKDKEYKMKKNVGSQGREIGGGKGY